MWLAGHTRTSYTHHPTPINLPTKSGPKTNLLSLAQSSIPPCRLNPFLFNGHLQTMYTALHAVGPPIYYKRRIFESTHSLYPGQFTVDFVVPKSEGGEDVKDETLPERTTNYTAEEEGELRSEDDTPMLVCLHGLTGGSHEVYLREVIAPITAAGWAACVINSRGCAQSKITTPMLFSARSTWDLRQLIRWLRKAFPNRPLYGVGCSLGANIMTSMFVTESVGFRD
jgi:predicted alpha/beta-fold hydrolase